MSRRSDTRSRWLAHVRRWQRSGLTRSVYCARNDLNAHAFDYWRRQSGDAKPRRAVARPRGASRAARALVPVVVSCDSGAGAKGIELMLSERLRLRAAAGTDPAWLGALVRELLAC